MKGPLLLRISSQNLKHGGIQAPDGAGHDRWPVIAAAITAERPAILCLQEAHGWRDRNHSQLYRAEHDLGMRIAGWFPAGRSLGLTLVMYAPDAVRLTQWEQFNQAELYNGLGVPVFAVDGLDLPLAVVSVHLPAQSAAQAEQEAIKAAERAFRYGGVGVVMGDVNHLPLADPAPDPAELPYLNVSGLFTATQNGAVVPNRRVAQRLTLAGLTDAAAHLAAATGDTSLLSTTGQNRVRRDQAWVTPPLVPALTGYRATPHAGSDHRLVTVDLDVARIDTMTVRPSS
jgi:endonuclease/exonuclease/phosphatase family metal-dependent hydrolase